MTVTSMALLVGGILLLTGGAELLVGTATRLARHVGVSPMVIGMTVVAFGTSMPEIAIGVGSALVGDGSIALGNAVGSNVFNLLFILGGSAIIRPVIVSRQLIGLDVPVMILVAIFALVITLDGGLNRIDGVVLLALGVTYTSILIRAGLRIQRKLDRVAAAAGARPPPRPSPTTSSVALRVVLFVAGLGLLTVGSRMLLTGASDMARAFGMSELVLGLTVIAIGTSLPEIATSFLAMVRGQQEVAVGNIIGSNVFNVLLVLGSTGTVSAEPVEVPLGVLTFDFPVMIIVSLACLPIFFTGWAISRLEGAIFVAYYAGYLTYLILSHSGHAAQYLVGASLLWFALPLTAFVVGVGAWKQWRTRGTTYPPIRPG